MFIALDNNDNCSCGIGETLEIALQELNQFSVVPLEEVKFYEATEIQVELIKVTTLSKAKKENSK